MDIFDYLKHMPKETSIDARRRAIGTEEYNKIHRMIKFQEGILEDPYMRKTVIKSFCECCGRDFKENPELRPNINHNDYYRECRYLSFSPKCKECHRLHPADFEECRLRLSCVCNECNKKIEELRKLIKEFGKENE